MKTTGVNLYSQLIQSSMWQTRKVCVNVSPPLSGKLDFLYLILTNFGQISRPVLTKQTLLRNLKYCTLANIYMTTPVRTVSDLLACRWLGFNI